MRDTIRRTVTTTTLAALIYTSTGCYSLRPMRLPKGPESYASHTLEQSVTIGLDAQNGPRNIKSGDQFLDVNLQGKKIVALLLEARKASDAPLRLVTGDIRLVLADGTELPPVASEVAAKKGKRSGALVVFPWVVPLLSALGVIVSAVLVAKANRNMRADFAQKSLPDPCNLSKDQPSLGYVYFVLPAKHRNLTGAKVRVPVEDTSLNQRFIIEQSI